MKQLLKAISLIFDQLLCWTISSKLVA